MIALGEWAETVADGAIASGLDRDCVIVARDHEDAGERASAALKPRDTVLIKGSRSMRMERVVEVIASEKGA